jgi:predicted negative regulator of RcsB-dependent stress response
VESYRSEEEQVEALKRWWEENGRSTIMGVVLALGLGFGWQGWTKSQEQAAANASNLYQQMLEVIAAAEEGDQSAEPGKQIALQLKDSYRGSSYAQFAALHLARLAINSGQPLEAEQELRWAIAMADAGDDVYQVAQLRLARVLAAQGKQDEALEMLQGASGNYAVSYNIARGDIFLSRGNEPEALAAYESAVSSLEAGAPVPQTLQDKLQYLGARLQSAVTEAG